MGGGASNVLNSRKPGQLLSKDDVISIVSEEEFSEFKWNIMKNNDKVTVEQLVNVIEEEGRVAEMYLEEDDASQCSFESSASENDSKAPKLSMRTIIFLRIQSRKLQLRSGAHRRDASTVIKKKLRKLLGMDQRFYKSKLAPKHIFRRIDADGGGTITIDEWAICLRRRLRVTADEVLDADLSRIFNDMASNGEGCITMDTFCAWWNNPQLPPEESPSGFIHRSLESVHGSDLAEDVHQEVNSIALLIFKRLLEFHAKKQFNEEQGQRTSFQILNPWRLYKLFDISVEEPITFAGFMTFVRLQLQVTPHIASDGEIRQVFNEIGTNDCINMQEFASWSQKYAPHTLDASLSGRNQASSYDRTIMRRTMDERLIGNHLSESLEDVDCSRQRPETADWVMSRHCLSGSLDFDDI